MRGGAGAARIAWLAALIAVAALIALPLRGHVDDTDAQMYQVVARNLARDHAWFDLRFLPGWLPRFREHPPFGFWPSAAIIRLFGEGALPPLHGLITLSAVAVAGLIARRLGGAWAGVWAILLLGSCEVIWRYGARPLLEPLLFLFATAAAGAALLDRWPAAAALGAIAVLVKGPFGLVPLGAVAIARLPGWRGLAAVAAAAVPLCIFVWLDPAGGWRDAYLHGRLVASAVGSRTDGIALRWFPAIVIARRFWPGFPFLLAALWMAVRDRRMRPLAISALTMVAMLCVPELKWGNHTYVAFPLLAVVAGVAAARALPAERNPALGAGIALGLALVSCGVLASSIGARLLPPPCVFSTSLRAPLAALPAGTPVLLVTPRPDLSALSELAAEFDLRPRPVPTLDAAGDETFAVSRTPPAANWMAIASAPGWFLLRRAN